MAKRRSLELVMEEEHIEVNVRGFNYLLSCASLRRAPKSRLAQDYLGESNGTRKYYYRNPLLFQSIADYYETGQLHFPEGYCLSNVREELKFWKLDIGLLQTCCWTRIREEMEKEHTLENLEKEWAAYYADSIHIKSPPPHSRQTSANVVSTPPTSDTRLTSPFSRANENYIDTNDTKYYNVVDEKKLKRIPKRDQIWNFLDNPRSSKAARVWAIVIMLIVVISVVNLMLQSVMSLRIIAPEVQEYADKNLTEKKLLYLLSNSNPHQALKVIDIACCIILSGELFLRFFTCRNKLRFLINFYTVTDLIGIIPMWVLLVMGLFRGQTQRPHFELVVEGLRLFRIFRMSRLVKHVPTLKLLALAIKKSYKELFLLLLLMTLTGALFGFLIFYGELDQDNYMNIPHGLWWALVTMTTVGYGDIYPVGPLGCVIGALCAVSGILVIAMPVPIIVNNFGDIYRASKTFQRLRKKPKVPAENEVDIDIDCDKSTGLSTPDTCCTATPVEIYPSLDLLLIGKESTL